MTPAQPRRDTEPCPPPESSPLDPLRSSDANELTDVIDGITCTLVDRDSDDSDDLFVVRVRDEEHDEELHVYRQRDMYPVRARRISVDAPDHLPSRYCVAAKKFVLRTMDWSEY